MMLTSNQGGFWRLALGLAVVAIVMLSGGRLWMTDGGAACDCPCAADRASSGDLDLAKRRSCCADPDATTPRGLAGALAQTNVAAAGPHSANAFRHLAFPVTGDTPPVPAMRGPPRRPRYLENRTLLL